MKLAMILQFDDQKQPKRLRRLFLGALMVGLVRTFSWAATSNWTGPGSDFNTASNWSAGVPTDVAAFNSLNPTTINMSAPVTLNELLFNNGASAYTLNTASKSLTIQGTGMTNNSTVAQSINNTGLVFFENSATAGSLGITNNNGHLFFQNSSTAENAVITNSNGGGTFFDNSSTAGNATIFNYIGGAFLGFSNSSTAPNAIIVNNDLGVVDISGLTTASISIGSIVGAGNIYLGSRNLILGGINGNMSISGIIADGGALLGSGGSLTKNGTATLTLSGINTYTGDTTVNAGTLIVTGSLQSKVVVNSGGTLTGTGAVATLTNNQDVIPGINGAGTLTCLGYSGTGKLTVNLVGYVNSALKVTGNANLTGGKLSITAFLPVEDSTYTIISAASITGTFANILNASPGLNFTVVYASSSVSVFVKSNPAVTSITPNQGATSGGTSITIDGTDFLPGVSVKVGGNAASIVTVAGATRIIALTPVGSAGAKDVQVINPDGASATLANAFTYVGSTNSAPTLVSIAPNQGTISGGTLVTINGTGFLAGASVKVGGNAASSVAVVNATQITALTPTGSTGAKDVQVINPDGQSATLPNEFTYQDSSPVQIPPSDDHRNLLAKKGDCVNPWGINGDESVKIYNHAGEKVWENSRTQCWNGLVNSEEAAPGVYVWLVNGSKGKILKQR